MFRIEVPASTANLGPGFDSLGMALNLASTFLVLEGEEKSFSVIGEGAMEIKEDNCFFQSYDFISSYYQKKGKPLQLTVNSGIPPEKGLGSSGAATIAGVLAASHIHSLHLSKEEIIQQAVVIEGHADNILPSLLGGLILSYQDRGGNIAYRSLPLPNLQIIVAVPNFSLNTKETRKVLPQEFSREDLLFNLQHMGLLVDSLYRNDYTLLMEAMQDRIHQPYRQHLIPGFKEVLYAAAKEGALGVALSGSGPSILAFAREKGDVIGKAMITAFQEASLEARYFITTPRLQGALITHIKEREQIPLA